MANAPKTPGTPDNSKEQYYSFETVLKELQIEDDELRRLVSEGEIRAFRDGDKMKFRPSDIDGLKKGRMTEPTIILPAGEPDSGEESEVLLVDETENEDNTSETGAINLDDVDKSGDAFVNSSSTSTPTLDIPNDFGASDDLSSDGSNSSAASQDLAYNSSDDESHLSDHSNSDNDILTDSSGEMLSESKVGGKPFGSSSDHSEITTELDSSDESFGSPGDSYSSDHEDEETGALTEPITSASPPQNSQPEPYALSNNLDIVENPPAIQQPEEEETESFTDTDATGEDSPYQQTGFEQSGVEYEFGPVEKFFLISSTIILLVVGMVVLNAAKDQDTPMTGWLTDTIYTLVPARYPHWGSKYPPKSELQQQIFKRREWRNQ